MKRFLITLILLTNLSMFSVSAEKMKIGINLNGVNDWTSEWPFVDIMKISRKWITHNANGKGPWNTNHFSSIPLDKNYYPEKIPFDPDGNGPVPPQVVRTVWANEYLPTGNYTLICEGTGKIKFRGSSNVSFDIKGGGKFIVPVKKKKLLAMEILESKEGDHLRNIRLIMPGFENTYSHQIFHPLFLERVKPFKVIRFMNWGKINNSNLKNWEDRPKVNDYTYTLKGVPYEIMIALVNKLDASPWICIPHQATDDYIRHLVKILKEKLKIEKKIYLEYSNETWNWIFSQSHYCEKMGKELGLPGFYGYRWVYHCKRACDIWRIFKEEYGNTDKLVKVIATQVGWGKGTEKNPYPVQFMLKIAMNDPEVNPDKEKVDAIAIAPYFTTPRMKKLSDSISVDEILNLCEKNIKGNVKARVAGHKKIADEYGLKLICYEGGQSLVRSKSKILTEKFIEANRNKKIYKIYIEYLDTLNREGVDLFCHFVDCGKWSKWGMWGAMEYQDQPVEKAHKYRALIDWMKKK